MIDNLLFDVSVFLRIMPNIFVSFLTFLFCIFSIAIFNKCFGYVGLCCYMVLSSILANIEILYPTSYELLNIEVLLGTVIFCSSFLACDIINKTHGPTMAKKAIYLTVVSEIFFLINIILTMGHKPLDYSVFKEFSMSQATMAKNISSIQQVFFPIPRLLMASYLTYIIAQMVEIWCFHGMKKVTFIKSTYIKHNVSLFFSSVLIDTLVFTFFGLCLMSTEPLSARDFYEICLSAIIVRTFCNLGNTAYMHFFAVENEKKTKNVKSIAKK